MKNYFEITWEELNTNGHISPVRGINATPTPQILEYLGIAANELAAMRTKLSGRLKSLGMFTASMKSLFSQIPGAEKLSGYEYVLPLVDGGAVHVSNGPIVYYTAGAVALLADAAQDRLAKEDEYTYKTSKAAASLDNELESRILNEAIPSIREHDAPPTQPVAAPSVGNDPNALRIFSNPEFGKIRVVDIGGEPWLVGKDVAAVLGYANASKAVIDHVEEEDKRFEMLPVSDFQNGNLVKTALINESGLYSLVLSSKLPGAKKFRRWVTSEVLPSIRKHGGYIAGQEQMNDEELMAKALLVAQSKIAERDKQISELTAKIELDAPKVAFADAVHFAKADITVEKFAKLLYDQYGLQIGRNTMFSLLRDLGYLNKNNLPYQKHMRAGYFTTRELLKNGHFFVQTLITGKGQERLFHNIMSSAPVER